MPGEIPRRGVFAHWGRGTGSAKVELVFPGGTYGIRKRLVSADLIPLDEALPVLLADGAQVSGCGSARRSGPRPRRPGVGLIARGPPAADRRGRRHGRLAGRAARSGRPRMDAPARRGLPADRASPGGTWLAPDAAALSRVTDPRSLGRDRRPDRALARRAPDDRVARVRRGRSHACRRSRGMARRHHRRPGGRGASRAADRGRPAAGHGRRRHHGRGGRQPGRMVPSRRSGWCCSCAATPIRA